MFRRVLTLLVLAAAIAAGLVLPGALETARADSACPWMDTSKTPAERAAWVAAHPFRGAISMGVGWGLLTWLLAGLHIST